MNHKLFNKKKKKVKLTIRGFSYTENEGII